MRASCVATSEAWRQPARSLRDLVAGPVRWRRPETGMVATHNADLPYYPRLRDRRPPRMPARRKWQLVAQALQCLPDPSPPICHPSPRQPRIPCTPPEFFFSLHFLLSCFFVVACLVLCCSVLLCRQMSIIYMVYALASLVLVNSFFCG